MATTQPTGSTNALGQTVVGVFFTASNAEAALNDLKNANFSPEQVSVVAKDSEDSRTLVENTHMEGAETTGAGTGAVIGGVTGGIVGWLIGIGALAIPGIGPVVAAGALATTLGGVAVGAVAGGLIGALVGAGVPEDDARNYESHVKEGRILLTVQANNDAQSTTARDIFDRHDGSDVHAYSRTAA